MERQNKPELFFANSINCVCNMELKRVQADRYLASINCVCNMELSDFA